jgi:hypothetical protein
LEKGKKWTVGGKITHFTGFLWIYRSKNHFFCLILCKKWQNLRQFLRKYTIKTEKKKMGLACEFRIFSFAERAFFSSKNDFFSLHFIDFFFKICCFCDFLIKIRIETGFFIFSLSSFLIFAFFFFCSIVILQNQKSKIKKHIFLYNFGAFFFQSDPKKPKIYKKKTMAFFFRTRVRNYKIWQWHWQWQWYWQWQWQAEPQDRHRQWQWQWHCEQHCHWQWQWQWQWQ